MQRAVLALLALAACKDHANIAAEGHELLDEYHDLASLYRRTLCGCKDLACADKVDAGMQKSLDDLLQRLTVSAEARGRDHPRARCVEGSRSEAVTSQ